MPDDSAVQRKLDRKLRREILIGRYGLNPVMRGLFKAGLTPPYHTMIETIGRRSGAPRRVPVAYGLEGKHVWLIAQHGAGSAWVRNFQANSQVRLLVDRRWVTGNAELMPHDDVPARVLTFAQGRAGKRLLAMTFTALQTRPVSVRVTLT